MLGNFLDPILSPVLRLPPLYAILTLSFFITVIVTFAYKYLTDQDKMRKLKADLKSLQQKLKANQKNPEKALKIQQELMSKNLEYMRHSFRPTLFTMIPLLIIFGWMNAHLTYAPLLPNEVFNVTVVLADNVSGKVVLSGVPDSLSISNPARVVNSSVVVWEVSGSAGTYLLTVTYYSGSTVVSESVDLIIGKDWRYAPPLHRFDGVIKEVRIGNKLVKPLGSLSLFGWRPGWLGTYILSSIFFSILIRRLFGIS